MAILNILNSLIFSYLFIFSNCCLEDKSFLATSPLTEAEALPLWNTWFNKSFSGTRIAHFSSSSCYKEWEFWQMFSWLTHPLEWHRQIMFTLYSSIIIPPYHAHFMFWIFTMTLQARCSILCMCRGRVGGEWLRLRHISSSKNWITFSVLGMICIVEKLEPPMIFIPQTCEHFKQFLRRGGRNKRYFF